jgi:putative acetyltransferase
MGTNVIRTAEPGDASDIAKLFFETVHAINRRDYGSAEIAAWAPHILSAEEWLARQEGKMVYVAVEDDHLVGFAELEPSGHIDCFYTHKDHQSRGIGSVLLDRIEARARELGLARLFAEVSNTAKAFFEHRGFRSLCQQEVLCRGVALKNFMMEKELIPRPAHS